MVARLLSRKREDAHPDYGLESFEALLERRFDRRPPRAARQPRALRGPPAVNATWWRPLLTVALFSVLPFAVFVNDNRADLEPGAAPRPLRARPARPPGSRRCVVADRRGGPARPRARRGRLRRGRVRPLPVPASRARSPSSSASTPISVAVVDLAGAVRRGGRARDPALPARPRWNYAAVAGALLLALPVVQYASFKADDAGRRSQRRRRAGRASRAPRAEPPDVYFFLLDGYGRADQLERTIGFDNAPFLGALARRGFEVHEEATAAYPVTFLSLASTLSMGYPAEPGELDDSRRFFDVGRRRQRGRRGLQAASATSSPSPATTRRSSAASGSTSASSPRGREIEGVGGEREVAILGRDAAATLLPALGIHFSPLDGYLSPEDVVARGGRSERCDDPLFAYAHVLTPHPPYRYLEGCALREDLTDARDRRLGRGGRGGRRGVRAGRSSASTAACCGRSTDRGARPERDHRHPGRPRPEVRDRVPPPAQRLDAGAARRPLRDPQRPAAARAAARPSEPARELAVNTFRHDPRLHHRRGACRCCPRRELMIDLEARRGRAGRAAGRLEQRRNRR